MSTGAGGWIAPRVDPPDDDRLPWWFWPLLAIGGVRMLLRWFT